MENKAIKILAISGSLRSSSSNSLIVRAIGNLVPGYVDYIIYDKLGELPHFNDAAEIPASLKDWKEQIAAADGVLICSPEYAFGVPGSLKNALDWTVSSGEFVNKPVALITASTSGEKAHASLLNTLSALSAQVVEDGTLLIPYIRSKLDDKDGIADKATLKLISTVVEALLDAIALKRKR